MAHLITDECIVCGRCDRACPSESIFLSEEIYEVDKESCTDCRGIIGGPQCVAVCPVECCIPVKITRSNN